MIKLTNIRLSALEVPGCHRRLTFFIHRKLTLISPGLYNFVRVLDGLII